MSARPPMTAEDARTFDRISVANAARLTAAALERGCACVPYSDWFTYRRWRAQGQQVQKGEKGTPLPVVVEKVQTDPDTGEVRTAGTLLRTSFVFCRHQVAG